MPKSNVNYKYLGLQTLLTVNSLGGVFRRQDAFLLHGLASAREGNGLIHFLCKTLKSTSIKWGHRIKKVIITAECFSLTDCSSKELKGFGRYPVTGTIHWKISCRESSFTLYQYK